MERMRQSKRRMGAEKALNIKYIFVSAVYANDKGTRQKKICIQAHQQVPMDWFQPIYRRQIYAYRFVPSRHQGIETSMMQFIEAFKTKGEWFEARPSIAEKAKRNRIDLTANKSNDDSSSQSSTASKRKRSPTARQLLSESPPVSKKAKSK